MVNLGNGFYANIPDVKWIFMSDSQPVKRLLAEQKEKKEYIDLSGGKKVKVYLVTEHEIYACGITRETLMERLRKAGNENEENAEEK